MTGAQIVNGLQTVKSIYNAVSSKEVSLEDLEENCVVQVKVIQTNEPTFISQIVQATNNQNPMSQRNLKANNREQKQLRTGFASLTPRWFFQVKEGEWDSLTSEGSRFFKQVVGFPPMEFKPDPGRKRGRVIDNQEAAKAWLAFIGFADLAGDRVTHYFAESEVYEIAFTMRPTDLHWRKFSEVRDFDSGRRDTLESQQGNASQYLLGVLLWQFIKHFVPSAQRYREEGLDEGVKAGKIQKASGSFTSPPSEQDAYLATNHTYQTWRLMANMKELLVEAASQMLVQKYGPLTAHVCPQLLEAFDAKEFLATGDVREVTQGISTASDLAKEAVFSRICGFLRHVSGQFWEEKQRQLLSTSRLRTVLLRREMAADFKAKVWEVNQRKNLDKPWKPEGTTFIESLPTLGV
ncbi:MAG: AIPR family protein [Verrucomicrobia bacterium]|nr:AIPR family protein [Verrucomicrobiota bacterium]